MSEQDLYIDVREMFRIFLSTEGTTGLEVLCGGVGMYGVKIALTDVEVQWLRSRDYAALARLARDVCKDENKYRERYLPWG